MNFEIVQAAIPNAFTIAILAAIESLLSCVVADGMINGKHRSDMELVAQGAGNIASALFGGIPATGAIARTAANIKNRRPYTSCWYGPLYYPGDRTGCADAICRYDPNAYHCSDPVYRSL